MENDRVFTFETCHSEMKNDINGLIGECAPRIYAEIADKCYMMGYARGLQYISETLT